MISTAPVQRGWPMLLPLLPHQRREGEIHFPRERRVLSQDCPKKKKKKLTYIYGQNLATNLVIANDYNSY